jgi:cytochrome c-type biogenesis protein CcmH
MLKRIVLVLAFMVVAAPVVPVAAQQDQLEGLYIGQGALPDPAAEARAAKLASQLQCPVCQGQSIAASPSPMARQMKDLIRSQVAEGYTDQQVREYFMSKYGEWVLLNPKPAGFNLLVYILPVLGLLGGGAFVYSLVRKWSSQAPALAGAPQDD